MRCVNIKNVLYYLTGNLHVHVNYINEGTEMKSLGIVLLLFIAIFFVHAKVKEKPSPMECSIAYKHYDGDILLQLQHKQIAGEEYKAANNNKELSRLTLGMIEVKETNKFQSKNMLFKLSSFLACESDFILLGAKIDNLIKTSELKQIN
jgi:hypothetical protein